MVAEGNGKAEESTAPQREDAEQAPAKDSKATSDKHALEHKWTLWFDNPSGKQKQDSWGSSLRSVYTFDTVEDFWWYAHIVDSYLDVWHNRHTCPEATSASLLAACTTISSLLAG